MSRRSERLLGPALAAVVAMAWSPNVCAQELLPSAKVLMESLDHDTLYMDGATLCLHGGTHPPICVVRSEEWLLRTEIPNLDEKSAAGEIPPGKFGFPATAEVRASSKLACARYDDGRVWCRRHDSDLGASDAVEVGLAHAALTVAVDTSGGCALLSDRSVWCWGPLWEDYAGPPDVSTDPPIDSDPIEPDPWGHDGLPDDGDPDYDPDHDPDYDAYDDDYEYDSTDFGGAFSFYLGGGTAVSPKDGPDFFDGGLRIEPLWLGETFGGGGYLEFHGNTARGVDATLGASAVLWVVTARAGLSIGNDGDRFAPSVHGGALLSFPRAESFGMYFLGAYVDTRTDLLDDHEVAVSAGLEIDLVGALLLWFLADGGLSMVPR